MNNYCEPRVHFPLWIEFLIFGLIVCAMGAWWFWQQRKWKRDRRLRMNAQQRRVEARQRRRQ